MSDSRSSTPKAENAHDDVGVYGHVSDERGHVVMPQGWCLACEAWHPDAPESARTHAYPPRMEDGLQSLPVGQLFIGANRYDTDDTATLTLWTEDGRSFDVQWPLPTWRCPCLGVAATKWSDSHV